MNRIKSDIKAAHFLRWPGRNMNISSCVWLLVISPSIQFLLIYRMDQWLYLNQIRFSRIKWFLICLRILLVPFILFNKIRLKSDVSCDSDIDGGVILSDKGNIILGVMKLGAGTIINSCVTIGQNHVDGGLPNIGCDVYIGSDCVIYGEIIIGDGATILPGTVLTKSIPASVVIQGNPARLVCRNFDNSELRANQIRDANNYVKIKLGN